MLRLLLLTGEPVPGDWCEGILQRGDAIEMVYALDRQTLDQLRSSQPALTVRPFARSEDIEVPEQCNAVLVSGSDPRLFAAARQLGQTGLPLLILTADSGPTSALFELISLWEEGRTLLVPAGSSGLEQLTQQLAWTGPLDRIEFERQIIPVSNGRQLLSESDAHRWFFQDVRWLTHLATRAAENSSASWENVQAIWTGLRDGDMAQGMVTLSGQQVPEANWTLRTTTATPGWKLTLWSGATPTVLTSDEYPESLTGDMTATLSQFAAAIQGTPDDSWNDVLRCGHLLAAVQRSAQRQRKVPVHFEEVSERSQFKTQMSTIGCGVLLWAMFGMIFMLAVAGTLDPRDRELRSAQAAGFVFEQDDFTPQVSSFTHSGEERFRKVRDNWNSTTAPIIIDASGTSPETVKQQLDYVQASLDLNKLNAGENRVIARPVEGRWFERLVIAGWCVVFVPLGIFLLFQLFLSVSHPGRQETNESASSA